MMIYVGANTKIKNKKRREEIAYIVTSIDDQLEGFRCMKNKDQVGI